MPHLSVQCASDDMLLGALLDAPGPDRPEGARSRALETLRTLADAEATAHRVSVDDVHFHEVGALDAIDDIVGVATALDDLGITEVYADTVAVGIGTVQTVHGLLPVPDPAMGKLFAGTGATLTAEPVAHELCTPAGTALLVCQVRSNWGTPPPARVFGTGTGAGTADHPRAQNVVQVMPLEPQAATATPAAVAGVGR